MPGRLLNSQGLAGLTRLTGQTGSITMAIHENGQTMFTLGGGISCFAMVTLRRSDGRAFSNGRTVGLDGGMWTTSPTRKCGPHSQECNRPLRPMTRSATTTQVSRPRRAAPAVRRINPRFSGVTPMLWTEGIEEIAVRTANRLADLPVQAQNEPCDDN